MAGATGAMGRRLVPLLVAEGNAVAAMARSPGKVDELVSSGAQRVVADALDRDAVGSAVADASPRLSSTS